MAESTGTDGSDILVGTAAGDTILGLGGNDAIFALAGGDTVQGGLGDDIVVGGPDADLIFGDNLFRGPLPPEAGTGDPAGPGNNTIFGGGGDDTVFAGYGADVVLGGDGDDVLIGSGSYAVPRGELSVPPGANTRLLPFLDGADVVSGNAGNDYLYGGAGNDTLSGGEGDDTIAGGFGADVLTGGPGADVFSLGQTGLVSPPLQRPDGGYFLGEFFAVIPFARAPASGVGPGNRDVILDFEHGSDRLDLVELVAVELDMLPQASVFLGTRPFQPVESLPSNLGQPTPQLRYDLAGDSTVLQLYVPSAFGRDGAADAEFELRGVQGLVAADFGSVSDLSGGPAPPIAGAGQWHL